MSRGAAFRFECTKESDLTASGGCGRVIEGPSRDAVVNAVIQHFHVDHVYVQMEGYSPEGFAQFREKVRALVKSTS